MAVRPDALLIDKECAIAREELTLTGRMLTRKPPREEIDRDFSLLSPAAAKASDDEEMEPEDVTFVARERVRLAQENAFIAQERVRLAQENAFIAQDRVRPALENAFIAQDRVRPATACRLRGGEVGRRRGAGHSPPPCLRASSVHSSSSLPAPHLCDLPPCGRRSPRRRSP
jgi:hypothetical protein